MIKIVVDSGSDIVQEESEALGLTLIPMQVRFGDEEFLDGVNISHLQFFEKLVESADLPKTSQINAFRFEECFQRLVQGGDEVVCITISSKLSGTFRNACEAAKKFGGKVCVVDSLNATIGERILCEYAMKLAKSESSASEVAQILDEQKRRIKVLGVLDTLKYLKKGGRISTVAAFTGELLSIKPVVAVEGGEVKLVGKAMGSKKGNNLLMQLALKCGIDFDMPYALAYSGFSDAFLKKYLQDSESLWRGHVDVEQIPSYMIGSTIGTHVGPGAIAVAFFAAENV